ncbi:MAG: metal ABC transporter permease [Propionibacteriaceae bacterium]
MEFFTDPFLLGLQQRALTAGLIAAVMASMVGVWLVLRGMSFFGDAFVHGVLPGIAAAVVLHFNPLLGAAIAIAVMVAGIELIHRTTTLKEDTAIGLLFVGMLALGVMIISKSKSYTGSLTSILFGDALGATHDDIVQEAILAAVVIIGCLILYRPLMALAFDAGKAATLRMRPGLTHAILLILVAIAIIGSFRTIGTMLVFGLMVGPPATASLISRTVPMMMFCSTVIAVFSVWFGLIMSYHLGTAAGATMSLLPIILFFLTLCSRELIRRLRRGSRRKELAA